MQRLRLRIARRLDNYLDPKFLDLTYKLHNLTEGNSDALKILSDQVACNSESLVRLTQVVEQNQQISKAIYDAVPSLQQELANVRKTAEYERAWNSLNPLITVPIATYNRGKILVDRAVNSVLAQTYENFEIIVVGDHCTDDTAERLQNLGDDRIRFFNLPYRSTYPSDPDLRWLVAGGPGFNLGAIMATGEWIAPLDDDDEFSPDHLEKLLNLARENRSEMAYGALREVTPNSRDERILWSFPPAHGHFGFQAAIYLRLLNFFLYDMNCWILREPADWNMCRRMMEAGVRLATTRDVVVSYFPSKSWKQEEATGPGASTVPDAESGQLGQDEEGGWSSSDHPVGMKNDDLPSLPLPEWEYVPEGWAREANDPAVKGWDVNSVAEALKSKWPSFVRAVQSGGPLGIYHEVPEGQSISENNEFAHNMVMSYGYVLALAARFKRSVSILDWGGGIGHYYLISRAALPDAAIDYTCLDLPHLCEVGRMLLPEVTFASDDSPLAATYDLAVMSGSLQYSRDWRATLGQIGTCAGYVYVTRVPTVSEVPSFVDLQRAYAYGYDTEYLGWVFNRQELLDEAASSGLHLVREFIGFGSHFIEGAPEGPIVSRGFLFQNSSTLVQSGTVEN